ncbi:MAG: polyphosphate polymerase domain-containing protein [Clostridiales bacterium]|jgi:hypothetical protein|nr:polyphosphate polymerase domain-containing protein [Clostridiales bacterium]
MQKKKFRHEWKHTVNLADCLILRQRLRMVTESDEFALDNGTYRVRSLYFDNFENKALREKLDGVNNREKFRIRYYNGNDRFIRLEKKEKISGLCRKETAPMTRLECDRLLRGDVEWMASCGRPLLVELYAKMCYQSLRPKTLVDYLREPFVYAPGNVRVTIDSDIRSGLNSWDLFSSALPTMRACSKNTAVLEVKYDEYIPDLINDIIQLCNRQCSAYSKYAACRMYG